MFAQNCRSVFIESGSAHSFFFIRSQLKNDYKQKTGFAINNQVVLRQYMISLSHHYICCPFTMVCLMNWQLKLSLAEVQAHLFCRLKWRN